MGAAGGPARAGAMLVISRQTASERIPQDANLSFDGSPGREINLIVLYMVVSTSRDLRRKTKGAGALCH